MSLLDTLAGTDEAATTHPKTLTTGVPVKSSAPSPSTKPHVTVIQYNANLDPQADAFLSWLWQRMKKDELVDLYFPGQTETGFTSLVQMFAGSAQAALFDTNNGSDQWDKRIPGFITWSIQQFGSAPVLIAGFIFFREFWDHKTTDDAGAAAFEHWFTKTKVEEVLGVCPAQHHAAIRYNKRVGLHERMRLKNCALFKGNPCDAIIFGISRDEWNERRLHALEAD